MGFKNFKVSYNLGVLRDNCFYFDYCCDIFKRVINMIYVGVLIF